MSARMSRMLQMSLFFLCKPLRLLRRWRKIVIISLLFILAFVQVICAVALIWQYSKRLSDPRVEEEILEVYESVFWAVNTSFVIDSSGKYRIVKWLVDHEEEKEDPVGEATLVTHCSPNHLHHLIELHNTWDGPVSVAVFAADRDELSFAVELLMSVRQCMSSTLNRVTVQLVSLLSTFTALQFMVRHPVSCVGFPESLQQFRNTTNYERDHVYPNNLLRNVALDGAVSDYVFVVDIDMIPSAGLHAAFKYFTRGSVIGNLTAYVVPVFEVQTGAVVPLDRPTLLQMWEDGLVRPFYVELCWKCQRHTDYTAWRHLSSVEARQLSVGYIATWHDPWEPFYIVPYFAPRYDENFKQYGFNRISQSCELHVAGYQFAVLDNAFLVHRGFKTASGFHAKKESEQNMNRLRFRQFKEMLKVRYANSTRRC